MTDLPRDDDGNIITSAGFGECWFAMIEYNTDSEGREIDVEDEETQRESVTYHGPFDTPQEAADWLNAWPDGDTEIHEMTVLLMNRVTPKEDS